MTDASNKRCLTNCAELDVNIVVIARILVDGDLSQLDDRQLHGSVVHLDLFLLPQGYPEVTHLKHSDSGVNSLSPHTGRNTLTDAGNRLRKEDKSPDP